MSVVSQYILYLTLALLKENLELFQLLEAVEELCGADILV